MADVNPWSFEGWSITGQSTYVRVHGMARAEARARDAGTTVGGRPPAPKAPAAPRDTSKSNPWSAAGWSRTAQAQYIVAHGLARAEARASDAGSALIAQGPPHGPTMAPAALVRPGSPAIYRVPGSPGAFVPPRRRPVASGLLPRVSMALGFAEAAATRTEQDVAVSMAIGLAAAAVLQAGTAEVDLADTMALGVTLAAALYAEQDLAASAALGITVAASVRAEADIAASAALGVAMAAAVRAEADLAANVDMDLGVTVAAALRTEQDLAVNAALGVAMAAAVDKNTINAPASAALGISVAATLRTEVDLAAAPGLGISEYTVAANVIGVSTFFDVGGAHVELQLTTTQGLSDGDVVTVINVGGTVEANGTWPISIPFPGVSGFINLLGSPPPVNAYTSGGQVLDAGMLYTEVDVLPDVRATEAGDVRVTQAGDVRVPEIVPEGLGVSMAVATLTLV